MKCTKYLDMKENTYLMINKIDGRLYKKPLLFGLKEGV